MKRLITVFFLVVGLGTLTGRLPAMEHGVMRPDRETRREWINCYNQAPLAYIDPSLPLRRGSVNLLTHLTYTPSERNQGQCGNCWAWAGTGCLAIALDVQENVLDRLSMQYINSCGTNGSGEYCCCGGWLAHFADFYSNVKKTIPWSNTNASWQDSFKQCSDGSSDVTCGSISTSLNYPISSISDTSITTHDVSPATAISNIKNVLGQGRAIWFGFFVPTGADGDVFQNFWSTQNESTLFSFDYTNGHTWDQNGWGHAILCVGYNDNDPNNAYWILLNSWGTTAGRPNGRLRLNMDMNYNCADSTGDKTLFWQTLDVSFSIGPTPVNTPTPQPSGDGDTFSSPHVIPANYSCDHSNTGYTDDYDYYEDALYYYDQETGPDVVYRFTLSSPATVNITLSGMSDDLDLFLCDGPSPYDACAVSATWYDPETISYSAPAGTYYVVVDGWLSAASSYNLSIFSSGGGATTTPPPGPPTPTPGEITHYGLMVGINNYAPGYASSLQFCVADATGFRDCLLSDSSRWNSGAITTLTDGQATRTAIRNRLSTLAATAQAGNIVVYYQASHGGQYSGTDCYLCSYNADYSDTDLASDLAEFSGEVSVIIVLDTCHSGGMFKNARGEYVWNFVENVKRELARIRRAQGKRAADNVGFIVACKYNEYADEHDGHGVFTGFLIQAFSALTGKITFLDLFNYAAPRVTADNPDQIPQKDNDTLLANIIAVGKTSWIYDYNGDGTSDIAIFRGSSGLWAVRGITRIYFGGTSDAPVPGDYNGDGTTEVGIFRGNSGLWAIRAITRLYFGSSTDEAIPGDYDGNGCCDTGIFRDASGLWAIRGMTRVYFGSSTDEPVPGYYNADGSKDIGLFRPSSGLWAIRGLTRIYFGGSTDEPVPGDYNGDGIWDEGIFRPSSGLWAIRGITRRYFGGTIDLPVPADYAGTGSDSIGIFRSSSGLWAVSDFTRAYFGGSGDLPVTR